MMQKIDGGILTPKGFKAGAAAAGIKSNGKLDVGLLWSDAPAVSSAIFTQNSLAAAPVQLSKQNNSNHKVQAVVVNSGNANCLTGEEGRHHALQMARAAAGLLNIGENEVIVASTGIIGRPLPISKVEYGIKQAFEASSKPAEDDFAQSIMTTDTYVKAVAYQCKIGEQMVTIAGCSKGSGMIQPNMATLLGFLTSDVSISEDQLDKALIEAARTTFNSITIDGETSTNDTLAILTNGQAKNPQITEESDNYHTFLETLRQVCLDLALMIVRDGEGANILLKVDVNNAQDYDQAKTIALAVANSPLVKTAAHGKSGNWGRIAQAVGKLGLPITEDTLDIKVEQAADDELSLIINLQLGKANATVYTCDLSKDYVDINVEYN
ncbi:MAG TPA: bifunctional glutamate N-acetyltransferase/amino-acid acetyltransferase ArgJ [Candidatus Saccharimonadales bacterium]|nr:bifunctional glutamate N-acetyltransferase/amino-acid acetyltransferase ArgJ [Candidatus Saccharimonadales bacterium]